MENKQIQRIYEDSKRDDMMSDHAVEKYAFIAYLMALKLKLMESKGEEAQKQTGIIERMERFMERLTFFNTMYIFQARLIVAQERQIAILEQEKMDLNEENIQIKKRIKADGGA